VVRIPSLDGKAREPAAPRPWPACQASGGAGMRAGRAAERGGSARSCLARRSWGGAPGLGRTLTQGEPCAHGEGGADITRGRCRDVVVRGGPRMLARRQGVHPGGRVPAPGWLAKRRMAGVGEPKRRSPPWEGRQVLSTSGVPRALQSVRSGRVFALEKNNMWSVWGVCLLAQESCRQNRAQARGACRSKRDVLLGRWVQPGLGALPQVDRPA
jgi:hypothetical protein